MTKISIQYKNQFSLISSCAEPKNFCDSLPCYHGRCIERRIQRESDKGYECRCRRNGRKKYDVKTDCKKHPNDEQKDIKGAKKGGLVTANLITADPAYNRLQENNTLVNNDNKSSQS